MTIDRLIQPDALKSDEPLYWSPGRGVDLWELFRAVLAGDLDAVERLVAKDPSLVRAAYEYRTALSLAVRANQIAIASFLLAHGADPTKGPLLEAARDRGYGEMQQVLESALADGGSAQGGIVADAIRARDLAEVRRLLDASPELLHARDERSNQSIHWAVMTRQLNMIDELVARGADINAQRVDGARPIQLTNGDYTYRGWRDVPEGTVATPRDVLAHLRSRGADCDICTAAYIGDVARVRELLDRDPSLANRSSDYVTYYACSGTPLRNAAAGGHVEIVKLLLEHGAHPNVEIESSADTLSAAIWRHDQPMIDLLCSYGASRSVHLLAYSGDVQTAAAVFAANPALADDPIALENAASQGHEPFVRLMLRYRPLLATRIAVGVRSKAPQDPIKTRELTELLFAHGMNPSLPNWLRITPLHRFAERGDVQNAEIFIQHGADLDARDEEQSSTPLGWAARAGQIGMVELLLKHGAARSLPDDPPWATPLAWATRRGHREIVSVLSQ